MKTKLKKRLVCCEFRAEVCGDEGPTGEIVFVEQAILEDAGGNKVAGPFRSAARALARQRRFSGETRFRALPGAAYRTTDEIPSGYASESTPSVACRWVSADDVMTR